MKNDMAVLRKNTTKRRMRLPRSTATFVRGPQVGEPLDMLRGPQPRRAPWHVSRPAEGIARGASVETSDGAAAEPAQHPELRLPRA
eukprot:6744494-Lingulodinium_polyedra.AAC.1